jgi:hypothetical protein
MMTLSRASLIRTRLSYIICKFIFLAELVSMGDEHTAPQDAQVLPPPVETPH